MTVEKYDLNKNNWVEWQSIDQQAISEQVYDDLGARFPITWQGKEPIVDTADLPDGISMSDLKNALKNNHPLI